MHVIPKLEDEAGRAAGAKMLEDEAKNEGQRNQSVRRN